ncbi:hypothetical protein GOODEAATRI_020957 [Goodea atripinnis]|uniref:Uncharacterized protein n=1 Tax=Goodea atripinnis TaxID=208336 RepID=A0ABV0PFQ7_9TELE
MDPLCRLAWAEWTELNTRMCAALTARRMRSWGLFGGTSWDIRPFGKTMNASLVMRDDGKPGGCSASFNHTWNTAFTSRLSDKNKSGFRLRAYEADKSNSHYGSVGPTHSLLLHHIPLHKLLQNTVNNIR